MSKKFLYVDASGVYVEANSFETTDFVETSTGAGDAGKPVVLDASGKLDSSIVDASSVDHDSTSGAAASTVHTAFPLLDGTRLLTGVFKYNSQPSFSDDLEVVSKKYVDDVASAHEWQDSVLTATVLDPTALSPSVGDRYLINGTGAGAWAGQDNNIAEYNGAGWDYTVPTTGMRVAADDEPNTAYYLFGGATWEAKLLESTTASNGLVKIGNDIQVDPTLAGDALSFSTGVMSVNVDDSSIETNLDTLRVKAAGITNDMLAGSISDDKLLSDFIKTSEVDDLSIEFAGGNLNVKALGIKDSMIDFGLGLNQVNAADLPIADAGAYTDETDVEGALQELYMLNDERGVELTSAGVAKGDLVYVSANDTLSTYSAITTYHKAVGLANETVGAASPVKSLANDTRIDGVLSGATAGDVFYWDGSSHVSTMPSGGGSYVIQTGTAINATDLYVEVRLVKKNI